MPRWLLNQLQKAYLQKNRYQIKLLNQFWFHYLQNNTYTNTPNISKKE